jgi:hypothetical protein
MDELRGYVESAWTLAFYETYRGETGWAIEEAANAMRVADSMAKKAKRLLYAMRDRCDKADTERVEHKKQRALGVT